MHELLMDELHWTIAQANKGRVNTRTGNTLKTKNVPHTSRDQVYSLFSTSKYSEWIYIAESGALVRPS
jgi:hypothetical protein